MVTCLFNCITTKNAPGDIHPEDILWALYFLKQNPTEHVGAHFRGCSPTTYQDRIWRTLQQFSHLHVVRIYNNMLLVIEQLWICPF